MQQRSTPLLGLTGPLWAENEFESVNDIHAIKICVEGGCKQGASFRDFPIRYVRTYARTVIALQRCRRAVRLKPGWHTTMGGIHSALNRS